MRTFGKTVVAVMLAVLGACNSGVSVDNKNPKGTVGGTLLDAGTMMPLPGVAVTLTSVGGTFTATSDANGFYKLGKVPAGSFTLAFTKDMYVATQIVDELDGSLGNFPITDPLLTVETLLMLPVGAPFVVRMVDTTGAPVAGVAVTSRVATTAIIQQGSDGSGTSFASTGSLNISATSDATGRLTFNGLPDPASLASVYGNQTYISGYGYVGPTAVIVSVPPIQVMGQDNYSYAGGTFPFDRETLAGSLPQITLSGPNDTLRVLESNVTPLRDNFVLPSPGNPELGAVVPTKGPITMSFSEAVDASSVRASLITETGAPGPALTPTVNLNFVSLLPSSPLTAGARYNLLLHAAAALNPTGPSRQKNAVVPFFAQTADTTPSVVSAVLTGTTVTFTLSEPIGFGDGEPDQYTCVVYYEGIDFDGSGATLPHVEGEWDTNAGALTCTPTSPVTPPVQNGGVQASTLLGEENKGAPIGVETTGYATTFVASFAGYTTEVAPIGPAPGSSLPVIGTMGHLYFPHLLSTMHRVTGEPVGDLTFMLAAQ